MAHVFIGMSGGVDSSVSALLLQQAGYQVSGVNLRLFHNEDLGEPAEKSCCSLSDAEDARLVAVQPVNAARAKHIAKARVHIIRQGRVAALRGRKRAPLGHAVHKGTVASQAVDELIKIHSKRLLSETVEAGNAARQDAAASSTKAWKPSVISSVPSIRVHMASAPGMDSISARLSS